MFKKLFVSLVILLAVSLSFAGLAFAASSMDDRATKYELPGNVVVRGISWIAHTDGTFTATDTSWVVDGYLFMVVTDPGATAPTDLYDVTLKDSDGVDVMGDAMLNRSTTATEQATPYIGDAYGPRFVRGPLTIGITNNSVNGAVGIIYIYIWEPK